MRILVTIIIALTILLSFLTSCGEEEYDGKLRRQYLSRSRDPNLFGEWQNYYQDEDKVDPQNGIMFRSDGWIEDIYYDETLGGTQSQKRKVYYTRDGVIYTLGYRPTAFDSAPERDYKYRIKGDTLYIHDHPPYGKAVFMYIKGSLSKPKK